MKVLYSITSAILLGMAIPVYAATGISPPVDIPITITSSGGVIACDIGPSYTGTIPAAATQAGYTHCAANYDFTQTQSFTDGIGTHQWSNMASWLGCSGSTSAPYLFRYLVGTGAVPCDTSHQQITTDGGVQVLALSYLTSDALAGNAYNVMLTNGPGADPFDPFAGKSYLEVSMRLPIISGICTDFCINFDTSTFTHVQGNPCFASTDMEWDDGATSTGVGMAQWNLTCGTSSGNGTSGPVTPIDGVITTAVMTWGNLTTADNVSQYAICNYSAAGNVQGLPGSAFHSCASATLVPPSTNPVFHTNVYANFQEGPFGLTSATWGTWNTNISTYIQRLTVWECPGYQTGGCYNNPVITTHP
jgi:hypothetical protein